MRENAHNFYKTFTHALQNRYDLPWRAPYTFRCVAPTQGVLGLARELSRASRASPSYHEDRSS